ncbi:MAG TPA: SPOR domain-containing protein [Rhizomicrobium sp.]|nr:SPOR domain-containing protein [Rhizomicrobium sp.]
MANHERGIYEPLSDDIRAYDGAEDDDVDEEGSRLPLLIVIALLVLAAFGGVVWLAYTQGVQRGRSDAPRMIAAAPGPMKTAPDNPGGEPTQYKGLKIYEQPAPADEANEDTDTAPQPPTTVAPQAAAPVLRSQPETPKAETPKTGAPKMAAAAPVQTAKSKPVVTQAETVKPKPVQTVATAPPKKLAAVPPATAPATTVAPAPAAASGGSYVLQIGAYKSQSEANSAWHSYQAKHPITGGYNSDVKQVDLGDKGVWYRLRIGSFADKDAAAAFCDKLKADGATCFPTKP